MKTPTKEEENNQRLVNPLLVKKIFNEVKKEALEDELKFLNSVLEITRRKKKGYLSDEEDMIEKRITEIKQELEKIK